MTTIKWKRIREEIDIEEKYNWEDDDDDLNTGGTCSVFSELWDGDGQGQRRERKGKGMKRLQ